MLITKRDVSPDGGEVAIAYHDGGRHEGPHLLSTNGDGKDRFLKMHISPRGFAWSDDGKKVAYWGGQGSSAECFTVDIFDRESGQNITRLQGVQNCVFLDNKNLLFVRLEGEAFSSSYPALVNLEGKSIEIVPGIERVSRVAK